MPIEVALWRFGDRLQKVEFCAIDSESRLETVLAEDISIIDTGLLLIGRQGTCIWPVKADPDASR